MASQGLEEGSQSKGLERLIGLTDDVFAFAITVLVLDLVTPSILGPESNSSLAQSIQNESPLFLNYIVSFWVIGILWAGHHRVFRYIKSSDQGLLFLNLFFLFFVVLIPFSTRVLDAYTHIQLSVVLFALILAGASLMTAFIWKYASDTRRNLVRSEVSARFARWLWIRNLVAPIVFGLSAPLTFISTYAPIVCWLAFLPALILLEKRYWRPPS